MADLSSADWRTSTYSANAGQCVEVAVTPEVVGVRDTKDRAAGHFTADSSRWQAFIDSVKADRFKQ